eukprot:3116861-Heterocapsa_arctica.AAC.1
MDNKMDYYLEDLKREYVRGVEKLNGGFDEASRTRSHNFKAWGHDATDMRRYIHNELKRKSDAMDEDAEEDKEATEISDVEEDVSDDEEKEKDFT